MVPIYLQRVKKIEKSECKCNWSLLMPWHHSIATKAIVKDKFSYYIRSSFFVFGWCVCARAWIFISFVYLIFVFIAFHFWHFNLLSLCSCAGLWISTCLHFLLLISQIWPSEIFIQTKFTRHLIIQINFEVEWQFKIIRIANESFCVCIEYLI